MAETKLHPGIPVTNEFDGCEPPEDTRAFGDVYADDSRMMMTDSSRRTMSDGQKLHPAQKETLTMQAE